MVVKIDIGDLAAMVVEIDIGCHGLGNHWRLVGMGVKMIIETWSLGIGPPAAKSPLPHI